MSSTHRTGKTYYHNSQQKPTAFPSSNYNGNSPLQSSYPDTITQIHHNTSSNDYNSSGSSPSLVNYLLIVMTLLLVITLTTSLYMAHRISDSTWNSDKFNMDTLPKENIDIGEKVTLHNEQDGGAKKSLYSADLKRAINNEPNGPTQKHERSNTNKEPNLINHHKENREDKRDEVWSKMFKELDYNAVFHTETSNIDLFPKSHGKNNRIRIESLPNYIDGSDFIVIDENQNSHFPWIVGRSHNFSNNEFLLYNEKEESDGLEPFYDEVTYALMSKRIKFNIDPNYCALVVNRIENEKLLKKNIKGNSATNNPKRDKMSSYDEPSSSYYKHLSKSNVISDPFITCQCRCNLYCYGKTIDGSSYGDHIDEQERESMNRDTLTSIDGTKCECNLKSLYDPYTYILNVIQTTVPPLEDPSHQCAKIHSIGCSLLYISYKSICLSLISHPEAKK